MARRTASTLQEELYPPADEPVRESHEDARGLDLDVEQESPFLRGQKRVSVRRSSLPKKTATRLAWISALCVLLFFGVVGAAAMYRYGEHSWRFRVESSDDIETDGLENVTRSQILEVMGGDIGRNIFFVPLAQRQAQLEQIPWVESASVMRFVPNHLRVTVHERTPVAFARVGSRILLIDAKGTLMELPTGSGKKKYSFPVILGTNPGEPVSTRAARMRIYNDVVNQLDAGGAHYAQELSEIDLSDPDDVKIVPNDPEGDVLVHLGSANYSDRYKLYMAHLKEWRHQFDKLQSVDMRYERQIVVNPDLHGEIKPVTLPVSAMKAAMKAGVRSAVLITHTTGSSQPGPAKPVVTSASTTVHPAAAKKPVKALQKTAKKGKAKTKTLAKSKAATSTKTTAGNAAKVAAKPVNVAKTSKPSPAIPKDKEQDHP